MNILIFGGSGFIGQALVKQLIQYNYNICIICRNTSKASQIFTHDNIEVKNIDIFNEQQLQELLPKYNVVINLIGKLVEYKSNDFKKFHYLFPKLLLKYLSSKQHLIHLSALGIEHSSKTSIYAKTKLDGETEIINNSSNYNIIRPSIVFGENDKFFNLFAKTIKKAPVFPLIGGGQAHFALIYVEDLVKSIVHLIQNNNKYQNSIYEAYGYKNVSLKEVLQFIIKTLNTKTLLIHMPFTLAKIQAKMMNLCNIYLLTPDQVRLLKYDNIASNKYPSIEELIGELHQYETIVPKYLKKG